MIELCDQTGKLVREFPTKDVVFCDHILYRGKLYAKRTRRWRPPAIVYIEVPLKTLEDQQ
jgi:hypothetical protein